MKTLKQWALVAYQAIGSGVVTLINAVRTRRDR